MRVCAFKHVYMSRYLRVSAFALVCTFSRQSTLPVCFRQRLSFLAITNVSWVSKLRDCDVMTEEARSYCTSSSFCPGIVNAKHVIKRGVKSYCTYGGSAYHF